MTVTNTAGMSGGMFGTIHGTGDSCYLPVQLVRAVAPQIGDAVTAIVIANPSERVAARTPYLVVYMDRLSSDDRAARKRHAAVPYNQPTPAMEAAVWKYMLANRAASVGDIVDNTDATHRQVRDLMSRIGTDETVWRKAEA
jgi:hypothetical protein